MAERQLLVPVKCACLGPFFPRLYSASHRSAAAAQQTRMQGSGVKIVSRAGAARWLPKQPHSHARRELTQSAPRGRRGKSAGDLRDG
jgi:hypothetical protein